MIRRFAILLIVATLLVAVKADAILWPPISSGTTPPPTPGSAGTCIDPTNTTYGAKGDKKEVADGSMSASSTTVNSPTANFASTDVGKSIVVGGAISAGLGNLPTSRAVTIRSNTNPTSVVYTGVSNTISFTTPGTISDSANGLGVFTVGDTVIVGNSTADDGMYQVLTVSAGTMTVGHPLQTTITAFISSTSVQVATPSANAVTNATVQWGTDNTAAINAAFAAVPTNGGTVCLPCSGNFWVDATTSLKPNSNTDFTSSCQGTSPATIFTGKAGTSCGGAGAVLDLISVSNVRIDGLDWDGNKRMFGCHGNGVNTIRSNNSVGTTNTGTNHITIANNTFNDSMDVINMVGTLNTMGTGIANNDTDIYSNRFYGVGVSGIVVLGNDSYTRIHDNYIKRYAMASSGSGIVCGRYGTSCTVDHNQIYGDDVLYAFCVSCHAISMDFGYLDIASNNSLQGISGFGAGGTYTNLGACMEEGFSSNSTFSNNTMDDCEGMFISGQDTPKQATDAAMASGSNIVTAATYGPVASNANIPTGFFPGITGYGVTVTGAGPGGQPLASVIQKVIDPTHAQLRDVAQATVTGQTLSTGGGLNADATITGNTIRNLGTAQAFQAFVNFYFTPRSTADGACVVSGSHVTSATAAFTNGPFSFTGGMVDLTNDVGRGIVVAGCGPAGGIYYGIITAWNSATDVTVSPAISTAASGQALSITQTYKTATDGVCATAGGGLTITSATINFQNYDLQRPVVLRGAGTTGADLTTTITQINSATSAAVADAIQTNVASGCVIQIESDYGYHRNITLTGNYADPSAGNTNVNGVAEGVIFNEVLGGTITGNHFTGSYLSGVDLTLSNKILVANNNLIGNNTSGSAGHAALRIIALSNIGKTFWIKGNNAVDSYQTGTTQTIYYALDGFQIQPPYAFPMWTEYGNELFSGSVMAESGASVVQGSVFASMNNSAASVTPTATFADATNCGSATGGAGSIVSGATTNKFTVVMGHNNGVAVTGCAVTYGTKAKCINGSTCTVSPSAGTGTPYQQIIAAGTATGVTLTAQTDMKDNTENVLCTCF